MQSWKPAGSYGYSIEDAIGQGRKRMDLPCVEIFSKAKNVIQIYDGVLESECSILYRDDVRKEIKRLRGADDQKLNELNEDSVRRRIKWFQENRDGFDCISQDFLNSGYRLLLERFQITPDEAPVIHKTNKAIIFHSINFCPTLEACRILGLDTRYICKQLNENSTDILVKQIDKRLSFSRNYDKLRPYSEYCEESISLSEN